MKHFVAYHNTAQMGRSLAEGDPLRLVTNRNVQHLYGNLVWFIVGSGQDPKQYSLGSVFRVTEVGEAAQDSFRYFAQGEGQAFAPHPF